MNKPQNRMNAPQLYRMNKPQNRMNKPQLFKGVSTPLQSFWPGRRSAFCVLLRLYL